MRKVMLGMCFVGMLILVSSSVSLATWLDDDFDDGVVDTSIWTIGGDSGEVWESGTTLYHDDANGAYPRPYVRSRAENGYAWTEGIAQIWWDNGGRYAGLMTQQGGGNYLLIRKDITGGYWTLSVNGTNHTVWDFYQQTDNWYWEIEFDNDAGTVEFRGKKYASSDWDIVRDYTYSNSEPFSLETASYNTTSEWDRMAVVPEPTTIGLLIFGLVGLIRCRK